MYTYTERQTDMAPYLSMIEKEIYANAEVNPPLSVYIYRKSLCILHREIDRRGLPSLQAY